MLFVVSKQNLQKELGFVQGVVEKKNTLPVLSNILIESVGENTIRITGTDLDVTIRCDMDAEEITTPGSMCVQARKLFEIARLLPDAPVSFNKEDNANKTTNQKKQDKQQTNKQNQHTKKNTKHTNQHQKRPKRNKRAHGDY